MTFEEFIAKKKIDLLQFRSAEPVLFSEFESHYSQMGPKSFDHSKKFLFNKLRRAYHLQEEPKPVLTKEPIEVNEIASQAEPLLSPTVTATVYTPRFRVGGKQEAESGKLKAESEKLKGESGTQEAEDKPKPAYVPRFKPQPLKSPEASPEGETKDAQIEQAKPAFKPRFKPGITSTPEAKPVEEVQDENLADKPKPKYVPRFKPPQL